MLNYLYDLNPVVIKNQDPGVVSHGVSKYQPGSFEWFGQITIGWSCS